MNNKIYNYGKEFSDIYIYICMYKEEQFQCFNTRTSSRMDLVFNIDATEFLVDVTTVDANNPSNEFLCASGPSPTYFPGAASVMKAKDKWDKYRFLMKNSQQQLVPFVLEVQGR